jgi:hypothetical protein
MKFGLYSSIANPPRGEHLDRCVAQVIAEAHLAEASGFNACFFGEHHQDKDRCLPLPPSTFSCSDSAPPVGSPFVAPSRHDGHSYSRQTFTPGAAQ